jgi:hypothetical protein
MTIFRKMRLILWVFIFVVMAITKTGWTQEPDYVGAAKCKMCHAKQHKVWTESKHAKALEVLKPQEQKDPQCLSCHVTGYQALRGVKSELAGVQCESCHGPGSVYIKIHAKKDKEGAKKAGMIARPDPESCKTCHNEKSPTFKGFDYAKMWEVIKHPK